MKYEHTYFKYNDKIYCDYELWLDQPSWRCPKQKYEYAVVNDALLDILTGNRTFSTLCDSAFSPKQGDEIYVAPKCPYASEDLRRNYKIKRNYDEGVCNVLHPIGESNFHWWHAKECLIVPKVKKVFLHDYVLAYATTFHPNIKHMEYELIQKWCWFKMVWLPEVYRKFLEGTLKKPVINYDHLKLTSENPLSLDLLRIIYEMSKVPYSEPDAEKNMQIQLNVLNQTNWRDRRGTVGLLNELMKNSRGVSVGMKGTLSRYSKPIQEIFRNNDITPINEEDKALGTEFLSSLLNINGTMFVSPTDLLRRLNETGISIYSFEKYFNPIVKVSPRT